MIAARQIFLGTSQSNAEEAMYKEMFLACVSSVPVGKTVVIESDEVTLIGPYFLSGRCWNESGGNPSYLQSTGRVSVSFPNATQCGVGGLGGCFDSCGLVSVNLPNVTTLKGGKNFQYYWGTEISLPKVTSFANHEFSYSSTLKTLNLPSVTSKSGSFFVYQDSALEDVYLPNMTLSQLGGASYIAQQACNSAAVFHLADGDYDYQGNPISA